jgi:hypothetical protein
MSSESFAELRRIKRLPIETGTQPVMKKRSYHRSFELYTAMYTQSFKCYVCKKRIAAKQEFWNGGHGYRAHRGCVKEVPKSP